MIVQAYWVECYEARITALKLERPSKSAREVRMDAIKEACPIHQLKEKEPRNKLAIWRGYREIKEAGGWQLRHSFEVAADTLHPEWRQLLKAIGQQPPPRINRCMCFPSLYGSPRSPPPLQIFQTTNGRNNGVVTRCAFERGVLRLGLKAWT
ncbi:hypothetical protein EMCG_01191 [[Emmonsia] crescens]|uniref:Uncharacterized protein n=1 Tax=[Emmonsia] crescens TaxID=73230 RepID=A0A0G2JAI8_9EURO|nr:hypothetical protein EMCG_01191 [Emmonsia crescens UAMH 3008]